MIERCAERSAKSKALNRHRTYNLLVKNSRGDKEPRPIIP